MQNYIPWIISGASVLLALLTYLRNGAKDQNAESTAVHEGMLKANLKLDQICASLNEIRTDTKSMQNRINTIDTELAVIKRDLKTAFNLIDELKTQ